MRWAAVLVACLCVASGSARSDAFHVVLLKRSDGTLAYENRGISRLIWASGVTELKASPRLRALRRMAEHFCIRRIYKPGVPPTSVDRSWRCYDGGGATRSVPSE